jgi:phytoene dehydrogenase-like protein
MATVRLRIGLPALRVDVRRRAARPRPLFLRSSVDEETDTDDVAPPRGDLSHETDVVVVGAGVSGLCCAAALASQGVRVTVVEAHDVAGGAAHGFTRRGFHFDAGPSFYFGLQDAPGTSLNALKQTLDLLGESVPCASYDRWHVYTPQGSFDCTTSEAEYAQTVRRFAGDEGAAQWRSLRDRMAPLSAFAAVLPFAALRGDAAVALSLLRFAPGLLGGMGTLASASGGLPASLQALSGSFGDVVRAAGVSHPFLCALLDLESFVISGCLCDGTPAPEMAFVLSQRFRDEALLDHPVGGGVAWIDALVRGIEKRGGRLHLRAPVERILVEGGRATGVKLAGGRGTVKARRAVVSSASIWDTPRLLPPGALPPAAAAAAAATPECGSFIHLHLGFDAANLDLAALGIHHLVVNDFSVGAIAADRNVINVSIPSALDSTLAPPGLAVAHVYGAANEPFDDWKRLQRGSAEYKKLKEERSQVLWAALERVIPDVRSRAKLTLVGTPLTHARYLRRHRGSYGPATAPNKWPGPTTPIDGLLQCGDSTFPGIGIPAASASGLIAANTLLPVSAQLRMLDAMGRRI